MLYFVHACCLLLDIDAYSIALYPGNSLLMDMLLMPSIDKLKDYRKVVSIIFFAIYSEVQSQTYRHFHGEIASMPAIGKALILSKSATEVC